MGIDEMGVDEMGSRRSGTTPYSQSCFKRPFIQVSWTSLLTGGCLLLDESSAESSCMTFMQQ